LGALVLGHGEVDLLLQEGLDLRALVVGEVHRDVVQRVDLLLGGVLPEVVDLLVGPTLHGVSPPVGDDLVVALLDGVEALVPELLLVLEVVASLLHARRPALVELHDAGVGHVAVVEVLPVAHHGFLVLGGLRDVVAVGLGVGFALAAGAPAVADAVLLAGLGVDLVDDVLVLLLLGAVQGLVVRGHLRLAEALDVLLVGVDPAGPRVLVLVGALVERVIDDAEALLLVALQLVLGGPLVHGVRLLDGDVLPALLAHALGDERLDLTLLVLPVDVLIVGHAKK